MACENCTCEKEKCLNGNCDCTTCVCKFEDSTSSEV